MKKGLWFQIVFSSLILGLFYYLGASIYSIITLGIMFLLIILLKEKLYGRTKDAIHKYFPSVSKLPSWIQKIIILVLFILVYILIREIVFAVLKIAEVYVRGLMMEGINQSVSG